MSKLKFFLGAAVVIGMFAATSCKKTTNNNTVVQDSVYYSAWMPLSMQMNGVDPNTGDTVYEQQISAPAITAKTISQGAVLGYYGYPTQSGDTLMFDEAEFGGFAYISYTPGSIDIASEGGDLSYANGGYLFKYVVIPGNVLATSFNGMTQQQLNKLNFSDVQKTLNAAKQASGNTFNP